MFRKRRPSKPGNERGFDGSVYLHLHPLPFELDGDALTNHSRLMTQAVSMVSMTAH